MLLHVVLTLSRHAPGTSSSRRSRRPTPSGQTTWTAPRCSWRRRLRLRQSWPTTALVVSRWHSKTLCATTTRSRTSRAEDKERNAPGQPLKVLYHHGLANNVPTPRVRARRRMRTPVQLTVSSSETRVALTSAGPGTHRFAVAWSLARQGGRRLANGAGRLNTDCVVAHGRNLLEMGGHPRPAVVQGMKSPPHELFLVASPVFHPPSLPPSHPRHPTSTTARENNQKHLQLRVAVPAPPVLQLLPREGEEAVMAVPLRSSFMRVLWVLHLAVIIRLNTVRGQGRLSSSQEKARSSPC